VVILIEWDDPSGGAEFRNEARAALGNSKLSSDVDSESVTSCSWMMLDGIQLYIV